MSSLATRAHLLLLLATCFLLSGPALSQNPATAKTRSSTGSPGNVALSPDASTIAWTLRTPAASTLHLTAVADPAHDITLSPQAGCSIADPAWSPSGDTLAFLAACADPNADPTVPRQQQIYLWSKATGDLHQLTHLKGEISQIAWSPNAKSLAFLFVENATRSAGALDAMKPWSGVIGQDNIEVQRVYSVDVRTAAGDFITPANLHVYEFDWAPTSIEVAYIAANPPGENNWWVAKLYVQCLALMAGALDACPKQRVAFDPNTTPTTLHGLQIAVPRWSPDGQRIAFIGGLMSDQGSTGGDVWVVNATGGEAIDITPHIDGTPTYEAWVNNNEVDFVENRRGHTLIAGYNVATRAPASGSVTDLGEVSVSGGPLKDAISYTSYGDFAFVESSFTQPTAIYAGPLNALQPIINFNDGFMPSLKTISIDWQNEHFHVQGWLTFPKDYDPAQKYPLIVEVHGGPSAAVTAGRGGEWGQLGYFEFQPNPRGSFGEGEPFTQANRKDFGYGDLRDILKGMDVIEAKYPIDKAREGLTGWSYGGYMTMFAITQTHRFAAAVAGAGLSDWLSYYGENSIDQWMIPFFGASVYDDPAVYARSSPITFIKNVRTPTLLLVGDRDGECPAPQSFEFWHALRDLGVKTGLVVYPGEGHAFRIPAHIRDRDQRMVQWFAENMPKSSE